MIGMILVLMILVLMIFDSNGNNADPNVINYADADNVRSNS